MKLASWLMMAAALGGNAAAAAQTAPSSPPGMAAPAAPAPLAGARVSPQPAPPESQSDQRIRRREEASKRTLRSICRGC
jgi:hypothetical protein